MTATELLGSKGISYRVLEDNQRRLIVFYVAYTPFKYNSDELEIDAYYLASNSAHNLSKQIIETDKANGIATNFADVFYKTCAERAGLGTILKNNLLCTECGNNVVLTVLVTDGKLELNAPDSPKQLNCEDCNACISACPSGALDDIFCRAKCVRNAMNTLEFDEITSKMTGKSILGCNICRNACPKNKAETARPPEKLSNGLKIDNLLPALFEGRKGIAWLDEFIGVNYVRPVKLLALAVNALGNIGETKYLPYVERALLHSDERVQSLAALACKKIRSR